MQTRVLSCLSVVLLLALTVTAAAVTVDVNGGGDYLTIQEGIDATDPGDIVYVLPGIYSGLNNRDLDFGGREITVVSASGSEFTTIDCGGTPSDPHRAFIFQNGEGFNSILDGFTIINGYADDGAAIRCISASPTIADIEIMIDSDPPDGYVHLVGSNPTIERVNFNGAPTNMGGGLYCDDSGPTIVQSRFENLRGFGAMLCVNGSGPFLGDVLFEGNTAPFGGTGGLHCEQSNVTLQQVQFIQNSGYSSAGGMSCIQSTAELTDVLFLENDSSNGGGGLVCDVGSDADLTRVEFIGNVSDGWNKAGGMSCYDGSDAILEDVLFEGNYATGSSGAFVCFDSSPRLTNVTFLDNSCSYNCGGAEIRGASSPLLEYVIFASNASGSIADANALAVYDGATPTIRNATFAGNGDTWSDIPTILAWDSDPVFENCIIAFSLLGDGIACWGSANPSLDKCCYYGNGGGVSPCGTYTNMLYTSPLFCDLTSVDLTLHSSSPCLPSNNAWSELIGALGCGCGPVTKWYVDLNNTSGIEDGSAAYPFDKIWEAINETTVGDTVVVLPGTYGGPGNINLDFCGTDIVLMSAEGAGVTTIDATSAGDDRAIHLHSGEDCTSLISGFTITGGELGPGGGYGAGILCDGASAAIEDCVFTGNGAFDGGGAIGLVQSAACIARCYFTMNNAGDSSGGAIYCSQSSPGVTDCEFYDNGFADEGGAIACWSGSHLVAVGCTFTENMADWGGGVHCGDSALWLDDCFFEDNGSGAHGPGVASYGNRALRVVNSTFINHFGFDGGAIRCDTDSLTIVGTIFNGNVGEEGGTLFCAGGEVTGCTFVGSEADPGNGVIETSGDLDVSNTILAFNTQGVPVYCNGGTATLACCDVYGNTDGDYVDCLAGQLGMDGNISEDPLFCDLPNGVLTLRNDSPCAAVNYPACGRIGALGVGCAGMSPLLTSIQDVGNDQGRQLRLTWIKSLYDGPGHPTYVTGYGVYRRQDAYMRDPAEELLDDTEPNAGERLAGWDFIETVPAHAESIYQYVAPTLCDSTAQGGICWSVFFVRAMTSEPWTFFDSVPDSGYSVDNLAPDPPTNLMAQCGSGCITLSWDPNEEPDFDFYSVYRNVDGGSGIWELIACTSEEGCIDVPPGGYCWYRVTACDFNGNESAPSETAGVSTGIDSPVERRFALGQAVPNPFNPTTTIAYELPRDTRATLRVYDATGRLVRLLVSDRVHQAGPHSVTWDGRDDRGQKASSGVYFYRLEADDESLTKSMVLLK